MKSDSPILFIIPLAVIVSGFTIGGRDGAIISIVGSVALLAYSLWRAFKIVGRK
jgi:hypothetical protein